MKCGKITLLTSVETCGKCAGTGLEIEAFEGGCKITYTVEAADFAKIFGIPESSMSPASYAVTEITESPSRFGLAKPSQADFAKLPDGTIANTVNPTADPLTIIDKSLIAALAELKDVSTKEQAEAFRIKWLGVNGEHRRDQRCRRGPGGFRVSKHANRHDQVNERQGRHTRQWILRGTVTRVTVGHGDIATYRQKIRVVPGGNLCVRVVGYEPTIEVRKSRQYPRRVAKILHDATNRHNAALVGLV